MTNADPAEVRLPWVGNFRAAELGDILKTVYGCYLVSLCVHTTDAGRRRSKARQARTQCEGKLQGARRRRDAWEVDVHKGHLVVFDREILR